jgi:hypothetical protein
MSGQKAHAYAKAISRQSIRIAGSLARFASHWNQINSMVEDRNSHKRIEFPEVHVVQSQIR